MADIIQISYNFTFYIFYILMLEKVWYSEQRWVKFHSYNKNK